mmetsp:Transcript_25131/g.58100  ORF Transcript_25131/g.58100 Transcript_25131/m.58100 type:complete len:111 (-) Transcript_25131:1071-1403(-)
MEICESENSNRVWDTTSVPSRCLGTCGPGTQEGGRRHNGKGPCGTGNECCNGPDIVSTSDGSLACVCWTELEDSPELGSPESSGKRLRAIIYDIPLLFCLLLLSVVLTLP